MKTKLIEQYIEFAKNNGFNKKIEIRDYYYDNGSYVESFNNTVVVIEDGLNKYYSIIEIITSKKFIEAIVRGIYMGDNKIRVKIDNVFNRIVYEITINQAIAIRDGTLEDFISNLGIGIKGKK